MKTTGKFTKGTNPGTAKCMDCGGTFQKANIATQTEANGNGICVKCYDRAGDENSVSDGYMTCVEFQVRYGEHSEYCDCHDPSGRECALAGAGDPTGCKACLAEIVAQSTAQSTPQVVKVIDRLIADTKNDKSECLCGCGNAPKGKRSMFLPGHDARYHAANARRAALGLCRID